MASCGKDVTHEYLLELVGARYHVVVVVYMRLNKGLESVRLLSSWSPTLFEPCQTPSTLSPLLERISLRRIVCSIKHLALRRIKRFDI